MSCRTTTGTVAMEWKGARAKEIPRETDRSHENDCQSSKLLPAHILEHIVLGDVRNLLFARGICAGILPSNGTKTAKGIRDSKANLMAKSFELWPEIARIHAWLARFFGINIALPTLTVR